MTFGHESGLRGSNQTGASFKMRKLGSLPRLCWPLAGLSVGLNDLGAGSLGQVGQLIGELALRLLQSNEIGPSLSDVPRDAQKEEFPITTDFRDAQRRADKLGRHARYAVI
jgi:hypothetical protein